MFPVSYTHLRAHETREDLVCRLLLEKKSSLLFKNYDELKRIEPSSRSFGFGTWILEISLCCNELYDDYDLNEGKNPVIKIEEQLQDAIKILFSGIQKYF